MKSEPFISVCLPLYETEPFLAQCLRSVCLQDFDSFEVIVVSDASRGKDENGWSGRKITKSVWKECRKIRKKQGLSDIKVRFVEHRENMGLVEVRRSLCHYARGTYISYIDSDDVMVQGALKAFFEAAEKHRADIIQGRSTAGKFDSEGNFIPTEKNRYAQIAIGEVCGYEIVRAWLSGGKLSGVLWAKLIRRSLLETVFERIPHIECNMREDFLIFFFIATHAEKYVGIENQVYRYRVASGMSSVRKIDSLQRLRTICSTASVFTVISESEELKALDENEVNCVRRNVSAHLADNIVQLRETVVPELREEAHRMLCEYWGESFVQKIESAVEKNAANGQKVIDEKSQI